MAGGDYSAYVGRSRCAHDTIEPWRVEALAAALDLHVDCSPGAPLPLPFHFILFRETTRRSATAPDGHAERGDFLPPVQLPRRMYAGGRMVQHAPLLIGGAVEQVERIDAVDEKMGASGRLVIARVAHEYRQKGELCLSEERDLIYLEDRGPAPEQGRLEPLAEAAWQRDWEIDPVLLFRYSALTYNSHRIHHDQRYAREEEGYPDLVIHGPLLATLLCRLAEEKAGRPIRSFRFRAMRPFFLGWPVRLRGRPEAEGGTIEALTPSGETGMQGHFEFA
ncbi:MAG: acyl-CoA dehydrogenase [Mesorhizobium sp.]|nr:acyl-CoA dehydrogenase [Mesorhizobium sp.]